MNSEERPSHLGCAADDHGSQHGKGTYLGGRQRSDGSFPAEDGSADLEATSLLVLAMLGDGAATLSIAWHADLHRGLGWLVAAQRDDASFEDPGQGALQRHAVATYALTEASGLSPHGALVRGSATAALGHLLEQRDRTGGFHTAGATSTTTSAWATLAVASAEFFETLETCYRYTRLLR